MTSTAPRAREQKPGLREPDEVGIAPLYLERPVRLLHRHHSIPRIAQMTTLDWVIVAFVVLMALWGYLQGLVVSAFSLTGFAVGAAGRAHASRRCSCRADRALRTRRSSR